MNDHYFDEVDGNTGTPPSPLSEKDKEIIVLRNKVKVYIASPYTKGDVAVNVKNQMDCSNTLMDLGFVPFTPLYSHFQHMAHPRPYTEWIEYDKTWVLACDALYRIPSEIESTGADNEVELAHDYGIPVFHDIDYMVDHFKKRGRL